MKTYLRLAAIILAICVCALSVFGILWIQQYQTLQDDESVVVLTPNKADITYCTMEGVPLKMDLYYPEKKQEPVQVIIYVHGGSFTSGDKRIGSGIIDIPAMTARGYAVAAVNYRLMPDNPFPAEVEDVRCAIRFLRAFSMDYNLRTEKIGVWGGSAGGHLVSMLGLTNGEAEFESGEYLEQSGAVDAVVEMFGPTDLTLPTGWLQRLLLSRAFRTDDPNAALLRRASPIQYTRKNAAPFLIIHGEQDSAVPVEQARVFAQKMKDAGNEVTLVTVKNANHNFKPMGGSIQPSRQEISGRMGDFFDTWLK